VTRPRRSEAEASGYFYLAEPDDAFDASLEEARDPTMETLESERDECVMIPIELKITRDAAEFAWDALSYAATATSKG